MTGTPLPQHELLVPAQPGSTPPSLTSLTWDRVATYRVPAEMRQVLLDERFTGSQAFSVESLSTGDSRTGGTVTRGDGFIKLTGNCRLGTYCKPRHGYIRVEAEVAEVGQTGSGFNSLTLGRMASATAGLVGSFDSQSSNAGFTLFDAVAGNETFTNSVTPAPFALGSQWRMAYEEGLNKHGIHVDRRNIGAFEMVRSPIDKSSAYDYTDAANLATRFVGFGHASADQASFHVLTRVRVGVQPPRGTREPRAILIEETGTPLYSPDGRVVMIWDNCVPGINTSTVTDGEGETYVAIYLFNEFDYSMEQVATIFVRRQSDLGSGSYVYGGQDTFCTYSLRTKEFRLQTINFDTRLITSQPARVWQTKTKRDILRGVHVLDDWAVFTPPQESSSTEWRYDTAWARPNGMLNYAWSRGIDTGVSFVSIAGGEVDDVPSASGGQVVHVNGSKGEAPLPVMHGGVLHWVVAEHGANSSVDPVWRVYNAAGVSQGVLGVRPPSYRNSGRNTPVSHFASWSRFDGKYSQKIAVAMDDAQDHSVSWNLGNVAAYVSNERWLGRDNPVYVYPDVRVA